MGGVHKHKMAPAAEGLELCRLRKNKAVGLLPIELPSSLVAYQVTSDCSIGGGESTCMAFTCQPCSSCFSHS